MVAATVILLGIGFATSWFVLFMHLFKALKMPLFSKHHLAFKQITIKRVSSWILTIDSLIASLFLGLLAAITFMQVAIVAGTNTSSVIEQIKNAAMIFNTQVFNLASVLALINLLITASLIFAFRSFNKIKHENGMVEAHSVLAEEVEKDKTSFTEIHPTHRNSSRTSENQTRKVTPLLEKDKELPDTKGQKSPDTKPIEDVKDSLNSENKLLLDHNPTSEKETDSNSDKQQDNSKDTNSRN